MHFLKGSLPVSLAQTKLVKEHGCGANDVQLTSAGFGSLLLGSP